MSDQQTHPLLVGEIIVDFTFTKPGVENKLRLGGIAHAARGFWALGVPFSVAAILPEYLDEPAREFLTAHGCVDFHVIGRVRGAPNVIVISDATEVSDQGYDDLLRDQKTVELLDLNVGARSHPDALVFPGSYDLVECCRKLPSSTRLHLDVAYGLSDPALLARLSNNITTILLSTSSELFSRIGDGGIVSVANAFAVCSPSFVILKENRGGTRAIEMETRAIEHLPAQLGSTENSVGVGDVFAAAHTALLDRGHIEAGWRATYAAAAYSQTTYPDLFKTYVERDQSLSLEQMKGLSGVSLPWEDRQQHSIYLAAPDFAGADRAAIDEALAALSYHNFRVRRPIVENGELPANSDLSALTATFRADYELLKECQLVFAVPTRRDPGTLVEIGIAIEREIPVVVYDPNGENRNTMVIAGARHYSSNLDLCLNAVFSILAGRRAI